MEATGKVSPEVHTAPEVDIRVGADVHVGTAFENEPTNAQVAEAQP
jgi:hypothetical protein